MVALRKESVDRNVNLGYIATTRTLSLSARRAWIEISAKTIRRDIASSRSPQGERG